MRKILYGSAAAIGALTIASSSWAADITYEQAIVAVCEVTSGDNTVTIDLSSAAATDTVDINCNEPAEVTATATKGAIENDTAISNSLTGGVASVAYNLAVEVLDSASTSIGTSGVTAITGSGQAVTVDTLAAVPFDGDVDLDLTWTAPTANLYAGTYAETIEVAIVASP